MDPPPPTETETVKTVKLRGLGFLGLSSRQFFFLVKFFGLSLSPPFKKRLLLACFGFFMTLFLFQLLLTSYKINEKQQLNDFYMLISITMAVFIRIKQPISPSTSLYLQHHCTSQDVLGKISSLLNLFRTISDLSLNILEIMIFYELLDSFQVQLLEKYKLYLLN